MESTNNEYSNEIKRLRINCTYLSILDKFRETTLINYWKEIFELYGFNPEEDELKISVEDIDNFIMPIPLREPFLENGFRWSVEIVKEFSFKNRLLFIPKGNFDNKVFVPIKD